MQERTDDNTARQEPVDPVGVVPSGCRQSGIKEERMTPSHQSSLGPWASPRGQPPSLDLLLPSSVGLLHILFLQFAVTLPGSHDYSHFAHEGIDWVKFGLTQLRSAKERKPKTWQWLSVFALPGLSVFNKVKALPLGKKLQ